MMDCDGCWLIGGVAGVGVMEVWLVARVRPGHTPAFASLRVPFRCAKGDGWWLCQRL